jgi:hypothetical protein
MIERRRPVGLPPLALNGRLIRDSNTSGIKGKAEVLDARPNDVIDPEWT